ncbi:MAG: methylenetetrahydrofolate--tRNA-(uracil(54)-C(5))-methyltransferase (FADH(2)-oxidizing) TrmFO [Clostridia bacterium]|nr:methylenetetrahydrofolate--tRNA-(uracil(54)-C(5))-methyltransferase (FADH(2)-oxidizing) TrmFO [Clostridia bacterium]MDD4386140.1 methylenetetrahydrofolate--tRNA-(uracil(54)-C(5))-methyltransferase (FADH(2)-oxidizing) TrmFO [Clostridia bacterium]
MKNITVNIIGAGLAGCECAYMLAKNNIKVNLYEMKPHNRSEAHKSNDFSELVCSNSLKSDNITNACGLLKKEMSVFDSLIIEAAYKTRVEAGQALAVDRDKFSEYITNVIKNNNNISVIYKEISNLNEVLSDDTITVIATGPLTTDKLSQDIRELVGVDSLYFYDAAAPIIEADSINYDIAYSLDRYGEGEGDYINLPMNKEEYMNFYNNLITAESANRHEFDKLLLFEGCMPIEEMAKRGEKTLTFGMLKPVGLNNPKTGEKNYAVVQLRSENVNKTAYNLVGFQTSLKFSEQDRVFKKIPGLENAKFLRYGVMHKNTYINSSRILDNNFCMKNKNNIYFAGQISGVEGYVESSASGMMVAMSIISKLKGNSIEFPDDTMLGSLANHVSTENKNFQPMNANFGILKPLEIKGKIRDKKVKYTMFADRSIQSVAELREQLNYIK